MDDAHAFRGDLKVKSLSISRLDASAGPVPTRRHCSAWRATPVQPHLSGGAICNVRVLLRYHARWEAHDDQLLFPWPLTMAAVLQRCYERTVSLAAHLGLQPAPAGAADPGGASRNAAAGLSSSDDFASFAQSTLVCTRRAHVARRSARAMQPGLVRAPSLTTPAAAVGGSLGGASGTASAALGSSGVAAAGAGAAGAGAQAATTAATWRAQRDIVMRVVEKLAAAMIDNVMCRGYRVRREGYRSNGMLASSGLENFHPNSLVERLCSAPWRTLLGFIGAYIPGVLHAQAGA
jgi:hypothetical protein